jgi:hypothetical protein
MNENAEKIQTEQVTPAPETPTTTAVVETPPSVSEPVKVNTEKQDSKVTAAMIKMRQELREAKRKLAQTTPTPATTPPVTTEQAKPTDTIVPIAPVQHITEMDIEAESAKAIEDVASDPAIASVPGAVLDIINLVDTDTRLARLHSIDPTLAFREAKGIYLSKSGISAPPAVPIPSTPSSGMSGGNTSLEALIIECDKYKPGTKEYHKLATKIQAEMDKLHRSSKV